MFMCNLCLEMPFLPSRHSDSDTLDAWGQSSKSDRSTGTIPPRRLPPHLDTCFRFRVNPALVQSGKSSMFEEQGGTSASAFISTWFPAFDPGSSTHQSHLIRASIPIRAATGRLNSLFAWQSSPRRFPLFIGSERKAEHIWTTGIESPPRLPSPPRFPRSFPGRSASSRLNPGLTHFSRRPAA